jgi:hypothetical protein
MSIRSISAGTVHNKLPSDLRAALQNDAAARAAWEDITPLARNEFLCWVENAKANETRARRVRRTIEELNEGKRRPCCWIGCIHRTDKAPSKSVKAILSK